MNRREFITLLGGVRLQYRLWSAQRPGRHHACAHTP